MKFCNRRELGLNTGKSLTNNYIHYTHDNLTDTQPHSQEWYSTVKNPMQLHFTWCVQVSTNQSRRLRLLLALPHGTIKSVVSPWPKVARIANVGLI